MHLSVTYAFIADVDHESERFRWAGGTRFVFSAVARLLNLRHYRIRLSFLPHTKEAAPAPVNSQRLLFSLFSLFFFFLIPYIPNCPPPFS